MATTSTSHCTASVSTMLLSTSRPLFMQRWILVVLAFFTLYCTCVESTPVNFWNAEVARRRLHPIYKCTGKLRIACARVASECHVPIPATKKADIVQWAKSAASEIGAAERRRAHREAVKVRVELSPTLIERLHEIESENSRQLRFSDNQWFRVKVSCKRCDQLCWV